MYMGLGDVTQQAAAATVGSALLQTAKYAGPAAPFLAVAGALADIVSLFGPSPYNTYTTEVVNQVEADVMKPNLAAWQALPASEKTQVNQQAALQNFSNGWNYVLQACNNPTLGASGANCIADRQRGGKWDWWAYYYDPIANDATVQANEASNPVTSILGGSSSIAGIPLPLLLLAGGLALFAAVD